MKRELYTLALLAGFYFSASAEEKTLSDAGLLKFVNKLESMTCVTPEPLKMATHIALLCRLTTLKDHDHADLVPGKPDASYKIYVTANGAEAMKEQKAAFPVGALILKQKFSKSDVTSAELYTGMLKREKGFNPACGDWEFFVVDGAGKTISERGKTESCMNCHKLYKESDFVTKKYVKQRVN